MAQGDPARRRSDPESPDHGRGGPMSDATRDPSSRYYMGEGTAIASGAQLRAEATGSVDSGSSPSWVDDVRSQALHEIAVQQRYTQDLRHSTEVLTEGMTTRQPPPVQPTAYEHVSHSAMDAMIRQNADPSVVAQSSEAWVAMGNDLAAHQEDLRALAGSTEATWQGSAADAARAYLARLGRWIGELSRGAQLTGRQQEIHSQVLSETQRRMAVNPPVEFDARAANAHLQTITDPVQYLQQYQRDMALYNAQKAAQQQAARLMSDYDAQVAAATSAPAFGAHRL